jgi:hypothetical protein
MTKKAGSSLDRLNFLLSKLDLGVPSYRTTVSDSGSNLTWLKKHVSSKLEGIVLGESEHPIRDIEIAKELLSLLSLSVSQLKG